MVNKRNCRTGSKRLSMYVFILNAASLLQRPRARDLRRVLPAHTDVQGQDRTVTDSARTHRHNHSHYITHCTAAASAKLSDSSQQSFRFQ